MMWSYRRVALGVVLSVAAGCAPTKPIQPPQSEYAELGAKDVPEFLKATIFQMTDLSNSNPMRVSGYGLVVNLDGTGDTRGPNAVREYIRKEMQKHGIGSTLNGVHTPSPDEVLNDPGKRTAIVLVDGYIPPGAHAHQPFDVSVSALENGNTTSLHHGVLYQTDLAPRGGDPLNPGGGVINPLARVDAGPIVINPAYALDDDPTQSRNQKLSMRYGRVMNRGVVAQERPLVLKLRQPERRMARQIEARINERFQGANGDRFGPDSAENSTPENRPTPLWNRRGNQGSRTAIAKDEGEVWIYVPSSFGTDWERFAGVVMHTYFNPNADFATLQAKKLAEYAEKEGENAPLLDYSYCWEALGPPAVPALTGLYASKVPSVAYAAARAGAFLGDLGAQEALGRIARTAGHPFQITAVDVLGQLPSTAGLRTTLRDLLDSDQLLVRIAAYNAMVATNDPLLVSTRLRNGFTLDMIETDAKPIVYATRVGEPRIALIGRKPRVETPSFLQAMKDHLSVVSDKERAGVQVFYRPRNGGEPVSTTCVPDLAVVIARLGGEAPEPRERLPFQYADVVGILQRMTDKKMITSSDASSQRLAAVFQMQSFPGIDDPILTAPSIQEQRPQDVPSTQPITSAQPMMLP